MAFLGTRKIRGDEDQKKDPDAALIPISIQ
jgi:hypothetical protein